MTYDYWKSTNPTDEWLGPEPMEENEEDAEQAVQRDFKALKLSIMEAIELMIDLGYDPPEAERIVFQWCRE